MKNKRLLVILSTVTFILLIPLIAMQYTDEVVWTILDFVIMGIILLSVGFLSDFVLRKVKSTKHKMILIVLILFGFISLWAELAVGIIACD